MLVLLIVGTYAPALRGEFIWDDFDHVVQNERVTAPDGLARSWRETQAPGFYPVTYTTFFVEWRLGHGRPWLFHLDNILLHAGNALLIVRLGGELGLSAPACWFVAAVWALHPMQVASVTWIAERKNTLYVFFYLLSLQLYMASSSGARVGPGRRRLAYLASVALFPLAVLSKASAITLPAAIALVHWVRQRSLDRRFWLSLLPYVLIALGGAAGLLSAVPTGLQTPSVAARLVHTVRALWFYVATFLWPRHLLTMYPQWSRTVDLHDVLLALGLVATTAVGLVARARIPRMVVFGLGFFLLNAALVVGVVWFTYLDSAPIADHFAYLPNLGLAFVAVGGIVEVAHRLELSRRAVVVGLALWSAVLAGVCARQIGNWHDTEIFWSSALAGNPDCYLCHYNLGRFFETRGDREAAAREYAAALRARPNDHDSAVNLGNVRAAEGRIDEAVVLYRRAARIDPTSAAPHHNLGLVLASAGKTDEAIVEYRAALRLAPDDAVAVNELADLLLQQGRIGEAVAVLEDGLKRAPGSGALNASLAWIGATSSDPRWRDGPRAVRLAQRACELSGHRDADDLDTLAAAYAEVGRFADAAETARLALTMTNPESGLAEQVRDRIALYEAHRPFRSEWSAPPDPSASEGRGHVDF